MPASADILNVGSETCNVTCNMTCHLTLPFSLDSGRGRGRGNRRGNMAPPNFRNLHSAPPGTISQQQRGPGRMHSGESSASSSSGHAYPAAIEDVRQYPPLGRPDHNQGFDSVYLDDYTEAPQDDQYHYSEQLEEHWEASDPMDEDSQQLHAQAVPRVHKPNNPFANWGGCSSIIATRIWSW